MSTFITFGQTRLLFLLGSVLCLANLVFSQIKVLSPPALVSSIRSANDGHDSITGATATFGAPFYGESFVGRVFYVSSPSNYCSDDYKNIINEEMTESSAESFGLRRIILIERGDCTFVKKVSVAESIGADAVIISDYDKSTWSRKDIASVIMANDGHGQTIRIPSVMVTKDDGKILRDFINSGQKNKEAIIVQLQWVLPQKAIVSVDFWTEAGSSLGQKFLKDYASHANMLQGQLKFTPHYNVFGLPSPGTPNQSLCLGDNLNICSNPSDVIESHITGRDVLEEEIRQLCLWKLTAKPVDAIPDSRYSSEWWEYVRRFPETCPMTNSSSPSSKFGLECSYRIMRMIPGLSESDVRTCVENNGNELLMTEKADRAWSNLALRINGAKFSGTLDPIQVSKAICSAFQHPPNECSTLMKGFSETHQHASSLSASTILSSLAGVAAIGGTALFFYQRYIKKSMRAALRHEVMLEVRSQLQEYHSLEDEDPMMRPKRPFLT